MSARIGAQRGRKGRNWPLGEVHFRSRRSFRPANQLSDSYPAVEATIFSSLLDGFQFRARHHAYLSRAGR